MSDDTADRVLVLGYGDLTEPIIAELLDDGVRFGVITTDEVAAVRLRDRGVEVIRAKPSDDLPLDEAGLDRARAVVVATNDDARDALAILTVRQHTPEVRIVAAATNRENVEKLKRAGATEVISPASIGARLLVRSALEGADAEGLADRIVGT